MSNTAVKISLLVFSLSAVLYPLWVRFSSVSWSLDETLLSNLFPAFGMIAFTLLWLHAISGAFEPWLRKQFDFDRFVHVTAYMILVSIILHPLLLLIQLGFNFNTVFLYYGEKYIWFGIVGFLLLITYDIGKALKRYNFFVRHWQKILVISTIGFFFTFFHSIGLGSDLQDNPLRALWIFYGLTAFVATIYTYGIKKLFYR
ncbi:MAG: hypothetical protein WDZ64_01200 [Parcubacteria group bacterium]